MNTSRIVEREMNKNVYEGNYQYRIFLGLSTSFCGGGGAKLIEITRSKINPTIS